MLKTSFNISKICKLLLSILLFLMQKVKKILHSDLKKLVKLFGSSFQLFIKNYSYLL